MQQALKHHVDARPHLRVNMHSLKQIVDSEGVGRRDSDAHTNTLASNTAVVNVSPPQRGSRASLSQEHTSEVEARHAGKGGMTR